MIYMVEEIKEQPEVLGWCLESNLQIIRELAEIIKENEISSICIAARGTSDHAGVYGKYIFESILGIPVSLAASSVFTLYGKSLKFDKCMVIGISQSGKAADVLEVVRSANDQGALTVSITNASDSPLAQEAKFHLFCNAGLEKSVAATKTFTSQIFILAQLVAELTNDDKMRHELSLIPQGICKVLENWNCIAAKTERFRFMDECFVLSRGVNYAIALESALKIQETTYTRAKAFATSDFQHGPIAMIDPNIPVIVYAPEGPSLKDTSAMINRLKESQVELIVVSNNKDMLDEGTCSFAIPPTDNDVISPFYNVVIAQIFACCLANAKGLNPDKPRMLNKVTITK